MQQLNVAAEALPSGGGLLPVRHDDPALHALVLAVEDLHGEVPQLTFRRRLGRGKTDRRAVAGPEAVQLVAAHRAAQLVAQCVQQGGELGKAGKGKGRHASAQRDRHTGEAVLLAAGAQLTVGIDDVMPRNNEVVRYLRSVGIPVVEPKEVKTSRAFDLVLDCAAAFAELKPRIGFVELTRSGVSKYADKSCPVYVADSGRIKRIETCLGTGESYFRAMAQLGYSQWQGKSIVIFGSGKVGSGLITYAHRYGSRITVVTRPGDITDRIRVLCDAVIDASDGIAIAEAVSQANAVVTATGVPSAATAACPADVFIRSKALLANMGVEDEFGAGVPAGRVLEAKRPLNFILKDPTLMKYIDATMALHN